MKKFKKIVLFLFVFIICTLISKNLLIEVKAEDYSNLYLNKLEFYVEINSDGSMDVTETWNIDIRNTNTLYKTFEIDSKKYSSIENVLVKDVTANMELTHINQEMYHVTKNCYYGLKNSKGDFEIAWGVGLDNSHDIRTYEISYTVKDVIGKYNDYSELYWQFVGKDFEIDAEKITGAIKLPEKAKNTEEIKVWGHTEDLNGEIYVTDKDEIKFQLNNFNSGRYVEVRILFPSDMIISTSRTYNENRYDDVLKEEAKWAKQANLRRKWQEIEEEVILTFVIFVVIALCIIFIEKAVKYGKQLGGINKYKPEQKLEYFRELPENDVTPGEALYILKEPYNTFSSYFGKIFSATLLNLKLKEYIDLKVEKTEKSKEKIYINKLKNPDNNLKGDEKRILEFLYKAYNKKTEIEIKDLEKYIEKHPAGVESLIKGCEKNIENQLQTNGILDKKQKEEFSKYANLATLYYIFTIILLFWAFPLSIILLINGIICSKIKKNVNVLTQKGVNSKEKWKGLKNYMEKFSLLDEKEIPAIEVWEKYLVYATVFGISDKVLKQLKTVYPDIDKIDAINTSTYMYFMYHSNFGTSFTSSINSSISSSYSSATGGGGGFSGGGGGGRGSEVEEAEDSLKTLHR